MNFIKKVMCFILGHRCEDEPSGRKFRKIHDLGETRYVFVPTYKCCRCGVEKDYVSIWEESTLSCRWYKRPVWE